MPQDREIPARGIPVEHRETHRGVEPAMRTAGSAIGRLTRRSEFLAAAGGRRYHNERLTAQGLIRADEPRTDEPASPEPSKGLRIGFTITKRVGHATERNRIRRRLRAAVIEAGATLPISNADVVLVARRPALHAPFETLIDDLRRAVTVVTKPQSDKPRAPNSPGGDGAASRRRRGKGAPVSGASAAAPVRASGATASAAAASSEPAPARTPSPSSNACDGPTDG